MSGSLFLRQAADYHERNQRGILRYHGAQATQKETRIAIGDHERVVRAHRIGINMRAAGLSGPFCVQKPADVAFDVANNGRRDAVDPVELKPRNLAGKTPGYLRGQCRGFRPEMTDQSTMDRVAARPERQHQDKFGRICMTSPGLGLADEGVQNLVPGLGRPVGRVQIGQERRVIGKYGEVGRGRAQSAKFRVKTFCPDLLQHLRMKRIP